MPGAPGIPPLSPSPAPPLSWRTEAVGILGVTLMVAVLMWPVLDGSRILMVDTWKLTYPWAGEPSIEEEAVAEALGGPEGTHFEPEEPYLHQYDLYIQALPWYKFAKSELASGRWPHWNPYSFCGEPLYANHLIPLTHPPLLIAVLAAPVHQIHTVATFLTWWIGGLGLYLYLRYRRLQPAAALAAVALYLASGHYMRTQPFTQPSVMYYPWLFWASDVLDKRPSLTRLTPLAILLGLFLAAGHPAFVVPFLYMLLLHRMLLWAFNRKAPSWWVKRLAFLLVGLLLGIMISSIQNLQTYLLYAGSSRRYVQTSAISPSPSGQQPGIERVVPPPEEAEPSKAATLLAPVFQRRTVLIHPYVGLPMVLLALFGIFFTRPPPERRAMIVLFIVFALLAVPPIFTRVGCYIPGLSLAPFSPFAPAQFLLVLLAGVGIHSLMDSRIIGRLSWRIGFIIISALGAILFAGLFISPSILNPDTRWESEQVPLATAVLITGMIAILMPALSWQFGAKRRWLGGFVLPLALTVASILGHFYQYPVFQRLPIMPETQSLAALPRTPLYRVVRHTSGRPSPRVTLESPAGFGGNLPMWAGCLDAQGYNSLILFRQAEILKALDSRTLRNERLSLPLTDPSALSSPILDAMAVGYIISDDPDLLSKPDSGAPPVEWTLEHDGALVIYKRNHALPRWYLTSDVVCPERGESVLDTIQKTDLLVRTESGQVTRRVVLSRNAPTLEPGDPVTGTISLVEENPQYLEFSVTASRDCFFVLSDSFDSTWRALIDGRHPDDCIFRANYAYRAVLMPEGKHTLVFRYEPVMFNICAIVSALAVLMFLVFTMIEYFRERYGRIPGPRASRSHGCSVGKDASGDLDFRHLGGSGFFGYQAVDDVQGKGRE